MKQNSNRISSTFTAAAQKASSLNNCTAPPLCRLTEAKTPYEFLRVQLRAYCPDIPVLRMVQSDEL